MFECEYCKTKFINEKNFTKHKCDEETRTNELNTARGKVAYNYYQIWFAKRNHPNPRREIFIGSKYYKTFFKFAEYVKTMGIPDPAIYIELMAQESILPQHWYNDDIYKYFIKYFDQECDPKLHLRISLTTMERLSTAFGCKISEVFTHLSPQDMITLIQSRNLSPWAMLLSEKFKEYLSNNTNYEEQKLIESVINLNKWQIILETNRNAIPETRNYLKQLEL